MILSAMILSSQGWIRKLAAAPPSRAEVRASLPTGRSWQQHGGSRRLRFKALRWSSKGAASHPTRQPQPRLDLSRLFRFHRRMDSKANPLVKGISSSSNQLTFVTEICATS